VLWVLFPQFCESAVFKFCLARVRCEFPLHGEDSNPHCWAYAAAPWAQGSPAPTAPLTPVGNRLYWRHMHSAASCVLQATSLCRLIRLGHMEKKLEKQLKVKSQGLLFCARNRAWLYTAILHDLHLECPGKVPVLTPLARSSFPNIFLRSFRRIKLHNEELHGLYSSPSIVRVIKARGWDGWGMWRAWGRWGVHTTFWLGGLEGGDH
jgi:hypothetical protein